MKAIVKATGQEIHFDHQSELQYVLADVMSEGHQQLYVRHCSDGEAYFVSLQPITIDDEELLEICETGESTEHVTLVD